jgi:hypothetical protein
MWDRTATALLGISNLSPAQAVRTGRRQRQHERRLAQALLQAGQQAALAAFSVDGAGDRHHDGQNPEGAGQAGAQ